MCSMLYVTSCTYNPYLSTFIQTASYLGKEEAIPSCIFEQSGYADEDMVTIVGCRNLFRTLINVFCSDLLRD